MRYLRAEFSWPVVVVAGLIISVALSALSFYTIERWALRVRDGKRTPKAKPTTSGRVEPWLQGGSSGSGGNLAMAVQNRHR